MQFIHLKRAKKHEKPAITDYRRLRKSFLQMQHLGIEALLVESRRLAENSKSNDLEIRKPLGELCPSLVEIFDNLQTAFENYENRVNYNIMKYQLANEALHTGLWDMDVVGGDPVNPNNTFVWSNDFRKMVGFTNETDFPNKLNSWSDRLHPEDKERTLNAFATHLTDVSGKTPYDVKYRLQLKNGEYGYFRATGDTMRDAEGKPVRVAGVLLDIGDEKRAEDLNQQMAEKVAQDKELVGTISKLVNNFNDNIDTQSKAVEASSKISESIVSSLKQVSEISRKEQESLKRLIETTERAQNAMEETKRSVHDIAQLVEGIGTAIQIISSIASNTNLLSMNAAIEAAHAGDAGTGFAVVAGEIRRLSESTRNNSVEISRTLKSIIDGISITSKQSKETDKCINEISMDIDYFSKNMAEIIGIFNKMSGESHEVTVAFRNLKEQSSAFKEGYFQMLSVTEELAATMNDIAGRWEG